MLIALKDLEVILNETEDTVAYKTKKRDGVASSYVRCHSIGKYSSQKGTWKGVT